MESGEQRAERLHDDHKEALRSGPDIALAFASRSEEAVDSFDCLEWPHRSHRPRAERGIHTESSAKGGSVFAGRCPLSARSGRSELTIRERLCRTSGRRPLRLYPCAYMKWCDQ